MRGTGKENTGWGGIWRMVREEHQSMDWGGGGGHTVGWLATAEQLPSGVQVLHTSMELQAWVLAR